MSLTKEDLKNIEKLFVKRFDTIDKRFDDVYKRFDMIDKRFEDIYKQFEVLDNKLEEKFLEIERRDTSHELTFMKMFKRFDTLEKNMTKYHIRENNNRDRLDRLELEVGDLRMSIFDYNYGDFNKKIKP